MNYKKALQFHTKLQYLIANLKKKYQALNLFNKIFNNKLKRINFKIKL